MQLAKNGSLRIRIQTGASSPINFGLQLGDERMEHISMSENKTMDMIIPVQEIVGISKDKKKLKLKEITLRLGIAEIKFVKE